MMELSVSARSACFPESAVASDGRLTGVDMVVDALVLDPNTRLLWRRRGGVLSGEERMA
jgi:hypothetical protein